MLKTIIKKNSYQDSITLMLLTNSIAELEGVQKVSIMMGTPANKDILAAGGLGTPELAQASPNDIAIVMDLSDDSLADDVLASIEGFLARQGEKAASGSGGEKKTARSWEQAQGSLPDANLALLSIPGAYVESEAMTALDKGMHVFIFSDNVPLAAEKRLKQRAAAKGLLVMGPDCGTALIGGVPLAFANVIPSGSIGIVGASGTGIQEISTQIAQLGGGVSHALGTGGRDLNSEIGALTMQAALAALEADNSTNCIVVVSKPPAAQVKAALLAALQTVSKPVVLHFLGEEISAHQPGCYFAATLEEAARFAVALSRGADPKVDNQALVICTDATIAGGGATAAGGGATAATQARGIRGLYTGGTLACEAAIMLERALGSSSGDHQSHADGFMFNREGHVIIDLGDDVYTQGKPHPMIAPSNRVSFIKELAQDTDAGVVLLDFVLGYGAHEDMAGQTAPAIREVQAIAKEQGRELLFIATICGTAHDPQGFAAQKAILEDAGVVIAPNNASAVATALQCIGLSYRYEEYPVEEPAPTETATLPPVSAQLAALLAQGPKVINIGLSSFTKPFVEQKTPFVQFDWQPAAGGDLKLQQILGFLSSYGKDAEDPCDQGPKPVDEANTAVVDKILAAVPYLMDVVPAHSVIPLLDEGKVLLHAGPPIRWEDMTSPMQGSCVGAVLFEGWASTTEEARALLEAGEVRFEPCHHVGAVGPMGGITSAHMPVLVVLNKTHGNYAYCTMNEGIGAVLRFGAYHAGVIDRLHWMRDILGPVLGGILRGIKDGLNINVLICKAIAMGDEFHQRNIAGSLCFLKEIAPLLVSADIPDRHRSEVMRFLANTDQFFLNIMMAAAKAVMDAARTVQEGTIVTAMTRNGENFGIRISGMGDTWFTAPVNTPDGLYFTGYTSADANPDMGDSAITETFGVGGMAMIAAPAVTRFVGSGGFGDALQTSEQMSEICVGRNPGFPVPTWDFQGICLGIDARKVVQTRITPVINTGIAHRQAGIGQIGAGTVHPPVECFDKALIAYAEKLGLSQTEKPA
ncbi:MAG: acyl-CoA synthetase FdrA [Coriobacteriia bacterium]|nr:acyl-CoA synthetase FdrA [Coriobacteriia bacterium]